jgi:lipopolysaccharide export system permease protein
MPPPEGREGASVFGGILQRYVFFELLRVFFMALTAITGILVMAGIVQEASQQGLGPAQILKIIPLLVPGTLPYTIPATTLFAVSVVYGRLAHDNEITAIKAAGIPLTKVLWPGVIVGTLTSIAVLGLYQRFIPECHHELRNTAMNDIEELLYARLRRDLSFNEPRVNYAIWVKEVQGRRLIRATFKKRDDKGWEEIVAQAAEAELKVDLEKGVVHVQMIHGEMSKDRGETTVSFERENIPVPLPPLGANRRIRARELSNARIREREGQVLAEQEQLRADLAAKMQASVGATDVERFKEVLPINTKLMFLNKELWELQTERATRPALAFGCFFYVLIGCPVAVWFHRRDYLSAFVTCFLPIILTYYPLMMFGINLGKEGRAEPNYVMWLGNGVLGVVGTVLLWRLLRR